MADKQKEDDTLQRGSTMQTPATWRDINCASCRRYLGKVEGGRVNLKCPKCHHTDTY